MRKGRPAVIFGKTEFLVPEDPDLLAYTRTVENEQLLSVANLSGNTRRFALPQGFDKAELLLSNCGAPVFEMGETVLRPWESLVLLAR